MKEGDSETRIPAYFKRFKVRKFPFFAGQSGQVFAGSNRISDSIFPCPGGRKTSSKKKNIFNEGGRLETRIPAYFDQFKVRKFPFFAGQSGRVFAGSNRISDSFFFVSRWSKNIFKEEEEEGRFETRIPAYFDRLKGEKVPLFCRPKRTRFRRFKSHC